MIAILMMYAKLATQVLFNFSQKVLSNIFLTVGSTGNLSIH